MNNIEILYSNGKLSSGNERFSFRWLAQKITRRQERGKDTIICVVGERRNGKSNWTLNLIRQYIKIKKNENAGFEWSWNTNFPLTTSKAIESLRNVQKGSFVVNDEGGDVAYRGDTQTARQKKLIKFLLKSGQKELLTIIVLPDVFLLDTKILNMCHLLVAVPYRYEDICAFAFLFGRSTNPFIGDKFGIERIKRIFQSRKVPQKLQIPVMTSKIRVQHEGKQIYIPYPKPLFTFLKNIPTFLTMHSFRPVERRFEEAYIRNVKMKQLNIREDDEFI